MKSLPVLDFSHFPRFREIFLKDFFAEKKEKSLNNG